MPEHVLIPYEGSPLAHRALRYACSEFADSRITVLYVVDERTDDTASAGWGDHPGQWEEWLTERREHATDLFADAEAVAAEYGVSIETAVAVGRVSEMTLAVADEYGVDLIVVGAHSRSRFAEFLIGDVARALVRRSPIPVTTVREHGE
ncbi:universal stress protein [Halobaculum halobium]|uniref:Universal stress protein n=1 Tax=Halobaculum halobium TaxID=3032281 RepID=A0ABD5TGA9_9EURY|nr:universal stress protein [Halobaculum sp. SYNS20]